MIKYQKVWKYYVHDCSIPCRNIDIVLPLEIQRNQLINFPQMSGNTQFCGSVSDWLLFLKKYFVNKRWSNCSKVISMAQNIFMWSLFCTKKIFQIRRWKVMKNILPIRILFFYHEKKGDLLFCMYYHVLIYIYKCIKLIYRLLHKKMA